MTFLYDCTTFVVFSPLTSCTAEHIFLLVCKKQPICQKATALDIRLSAAAEADVSQRLLNNFGKAAWIEKIPQVRAGYKTHSV